MSKTIYFNVPITIIEGIFENHKDTLNKIAYWAAADVMNGLKGYNQLAKLMEARRVLQLSFQVNQSVYQLCLDTQKKYSGARAGLSLEQIKHLNQCWGFLKDSDKVVWLAFIALKSILGNKTYCKTNDLMLFARMNGLVRAYSSEEDLLEHSHPVIANHYTRRKRETLRKRLAEEFHIKCYSYHDRGYYITRRLSFEKLMELVELSRHQKKTYQAKIAKSRKKVLALIHEKEPEDSS